MGDRIAELDRLARHVAAMFHRLPRCPRALRVTVDLAGNIRIGLWGRQFLVNALVVDIAAMSPEWCETVLRLVLGVPGRHVEEVKRRALVSAGLTMADLGFLHMVNDAGAAHLIDPILLRIANALVDKQLLDADGAFYRLSDAGRDALAARVVS